MAGRFSQPSAHVATARTKTWSHEHYIRGELVWKILLSTATQIALSCLWFISFSRNVSDYWNGPRPHYNFLQDITIKILDIIHRPVFYWKHDVSEIQLCLRLKVQPSQLDQRDRASLCLRTPASQSQSHITTDGQSVIMSRYRAHSGTCDQILLSVRRLFSEICCLVFLGRPWDTSNNINM
jgi:hypothetical protein